MGRKKERKEEKMRKGGTGVKGRGGGRRGKEEGVRVGGKLPRGAEGDGRPWP